MITVKYEHVPGKAWRMVAVVGETRNVPTLSWPISDPVYTLAQAQAGACNLMRAFRDFSTTEQVAEYRSLAV